MKKAAAVLLTGAFLVLGGALASGAGEPVATPSDQTPAAREMVLQGEIVAFDAAKKMVTVKGDSGQFVFRTETSTRLSRGENVVTWSELKVGEKVSVAYREQDSEKIAVRITLNAH